MELAPKPILRWAGSKRKQLGHLKNNIPEEFNTYIEAFVGSGQLFINGNFKKSVINDINSELINFYNCLKEDYSQVFKIYNSFSKDKEEYYKVRSIDVPSKNPFFDAARFIFLNENCFNGLYRVNLKGKFNVPFSKLNSKKKAIEDFKKLSIYLQEVKIVNKDFEVLIKNYVKPNDFVYLDPPYALSNKKIFTQYDTKTFGLDDLVRLDLTLDHINRIGAHFLLSYADSEEIEFIKKKWNCIEISAYRSMSGFKNKRNYQNECLIKNYE